LLIKNELCGNQILTCFLSKKSCGEAIYQLANAEEMRTKLIRMYQQIEAISNSILKNGINQEAFDPNNNNNSSGAITVSNDQFKLQRNLRLQAVNYLKEYSFTLPQLPSAKDYEQFKSRRQLHLAEEMRRHEIEQLRQRKQIDDQVARNQSRTASTTANHKRQSSVQSNVTIDNVNGWIPSKQNIIVGESSMATENGEDRESNAVRIQIQLVQGYLNDAIQKNKPDEIALLEENLSFLRNQIKN
jgi:hypothetical protein